MTKLKIRDEKDRLDVAVVLVKNGYRVSQRRDSESGKTPKYALFIEDALTLTSEKGEEGAQ
jgi:hypothetical protein